MSIYDYKLADSLGESIDCLRNYEAKRRVILAMTGIVFVNKGRIGERGGGGMGREEGGEKKRTYYAAPRH